MSPAIRIYLVLGLFCCSLLMEVQGSPHPRMASDEDMDDGARVLGEGEQLGGGVAPQKDAVPFRSGNSNSPRSRRKRFSCAHCISGFLLLKSMIKKGMTVAQFRKKTKSCMGPSRASICRQLGYLAKPEIIDILKTAILTAEEVCSFVLDVNCGVAQGWGNWTIRLPRVEKPPPNRRPPKYNAPTLKVLHITDTHWDPLYKIGSKARCGYPMCCRAAIGMSKTKSNAAGKWGSWLCDLPWRTLDNMMKHIAKTHKGIDYIMWTGDVPPHSMWSQTRQSSLYTLNGTVSLIRTYFPNVPVYPTLANHDASPTNSYPPPEVERPDLISWLYSAFAKEWGPFLPNSTRSIFLKAGYYAVQARPGLRIISLNTNFCYYENLWLMLNNPDPGDQLNWFVDQLLDAELKNEFVHVIAHIPPGYTDCIRTWSVNYYAIVSRFENTITAQFFGHIHTDEFEIFYDVDNNTRPTGVGYIGPSATTHTHMNPGYRLYLIDGDHDKTTRGVVDFETWVMDLDLANRKDTPHWYKLYTAKNAYSMSSLLPEDWNNFYKRIMTNRTLFDLYDRFYWKDSPERTECDAECKRSRYCGIRSCTLYGDPIHP